MASAAASASASSSSSSLLGSPSSEVHLTELRRKNSKVHQLAPAALSTRKVVDAAADVAATKKPPPAKLGAKTTSTEDLMTTAFFQQPGHRPAAPPAILTSALAQHIQAPSPFGYSPTQVPTSTLSLYALNWSTNALQNTVTPGAAAAPAAAAPSAASPFGPRRLSLKRFNLSRAASAVPSAVASPTHSRNGSSDYRALHGVPTKSTNLRTAVHAAPDNNDKEEDEEEDSSDDDEISQLAIRREVADGTKPPRSRSIGALAVLDASWSAGKYAGSDVRRESPDPSPRGDQSSAASVSFSRSQSREFLPALSDNAGSTMSMHILELQRSVSSMPGPEEPQADVETVNEDGREAVSEGTLEGLVNRLATVTETDVDYVHEFLYTFRYFTTPSELLRLLIKRFDAYGRQPGETNALPWHSQERDWRTLVQARVLNALRKWVVRHFFDFASDSELLAACEAFAQRVVQANDSTSRFAQSILELVANQKLSRRRTAKFGAIYSDDTSFGAPPISSKELKRVMSMSLLDHKADDVAKQLTILEMEMYKRIEIQELLAQRWAKGGNPAESVPNLLTFINWFNRMASWVATEVCLAGNLRLRVAVLKQFLKIAKLCRSWNNLNTVFEIMAGLNAASVSRLTRTWNSLPTKYKHVFEELNTMIQSNDNWKAYRTVVREAMPPLLPYMGMFMSDLTFAEEGPTVMSNGRVNFYKMRRIARLLESVVKFQGYNYTLVPDVRLMHWFRHGIVTLNADELFKASYRCEASKELN